MNCFLVTPIPPIKQKNLSLHDQIRNKWRHFVISYLQHNLFAYLAGTFDEAQTGRDPSVNLPMSLWRSRVKKLLWLLESKQIDLFSLMKFYSFPQYIFKQIMGDMYSFKKPRKLML